MYSVTKHRGFVPSLEYFNKQVFGRDLRSYKIVEAGEFAYATIHLDEGSIGRAPERSLVSPMYTVFRANHKRVDADYLLRFLKSKRALAKYPALGRGTAERRKSIGLDSLGRLEIPLPPLPEQRRIASILDQADALRAKRRRALSVIKGAEGALVAAALRVATEAVRLGDLVEVMTGPFGSALHAEDYVDGGVPVVNPKHIVDGRVSPQSNVAVSGDKFRELSAYALRPGDLVLGRRGEMGRVAEIAGSDGLLLCGTGSMILRRREAAKFVPAILASTIRSDEVRNDLKSRAQGATMLNLNESIVAETRVMMPCADEQAKLATRLRGLRQMRVSARAHLAKLDELFASLQHRAFTGQL